MASSADTADLIAGLNFAGEFFSEVWSPAPRLLFVVSYIWDWLPSVIKLQVINPRPALLIVYRETRYAMETGLFII